MRGKALRPITFDRTSPADPKPTLRTTNRDVMMNASNNERRSSSPVALMLVSSVFVAAGCAQLRHHKPRDSYVRRPIQEVQTPADQTVANAYDATSVEMISTTGIPTNNPQKTINQSPFPTHAHGNQTAATTGGRDLTSWAVSTEAAAMEQETQRVSGDPTLTLFGEIEGLVGSPTQFGAQESIVQVSFAEEGADFDPDLDGTGTHMVFSSTQHNQAADIYVKSVDGSSVTQLTSDPADDVMPAFSPDNKQVAFASNRHGNWDVFVMDANGGPAIQVTSTTAHELHPSWSPDGQHLCFSRLSEQSGRWELWVTDLSNTAHHRHIGYGLFPEWGPDPMLNKIVFQRARERGGRLYSVWTVDYVDGEGVRPTEIASSANAACINPSWSSDGRWITFATIVDPESTGGDKPDNADVWITSLDGIVKFNVTNGAYRNLQPVWGRDGRIYFVSNRSGVDNVWTIEPDKPMELAQGPRRSNDAPGATAVADVPTDSVDPGP